MHGACRRRRIGSPMAASGWRWTSTPSRRPPPAAAVLARARQPVLASMLATTPTAEPGDLARTRSPRKRAALDVSGPMILLAMPRLFGFVLQSAERLFLPRRRRAPSAIAWEVSQHVRRAPHLRHRRRRPAADGVVRQSCDKRLHVSPFLDMALDLSVPRRSRGRRVVIGIVDGPRRPRPRRRLTANAAI